MVDFDFRNPDYSPIFAERIRRLNEIRRDPSILPILKLHYAEAPWDFISDWGVTVDPKNVERGIPATIPFLLFPKQIEWVQEVVWCWKNQTPMLTEKTRQMGFSWLSIATACTLCIFYDGMALGFGSRKEEYLDVIGDGKSLFQKGREFMRLLPHEFQAGWDIKSCAPHKRFVFPETKATITGEAGDNIGRGATTGIYFVDEAAFLERPQLVEASLSQATNCRIDISTPNGMGNPFAQKRFGGKIKVFTFHWRDDPRKDDAWYAKQQAELDPVTLAQEVDINYAASVEGVLIPSAWVQAAIDADKKLLFTVTGEQLASLDVADQGIDLNAVGVRHGPKVYRVEEWSGKGADIFGTVQRAFRICDEEQVTTLRYDADGLGAGVRGDARVVNEGRPAAQQITDVMFRGSGAVAQPEGQDIHGRKNQDFFLNQKAQSWWALRQRFQLTYRAVHVAGTPYDPDDLIVLDGSMPNLAKISMELSQPTYSQNGVGKLLVDKAPEGARSPNLADAIMMLFSRQVRAPMRIREDDISQI